MNILGAGPAELLIVFVIMLVVAGPKRMIQWAYVLGRYVAQLRAMLQETMNAIQKELSESGVDLPKDLPRIPNSFDILSEVSKVINEPPKTPDQPAAASPSTEQPTPKEDEAKDPPYDAWLPK
jgi:Sec-independent protein translocase protein TatA